MVPLFHVEAKLEARVASSPSAKPTVPLLNEEPMLDESVSPFPSVNMPSLLTLADAADRPESHEIGEHGISLQAFADGVLGKTLCGILEEDADSM